MKQKNPKKSQTFLCKNCEYITDNKKDFNKHLLTLKHQNETNETKMKQNFENKNNICPKCEYNFNSRTTLWRHKKKCINNDLNNLNNLNNSNNLNSSNNPNNIIDDNNSSENKFLQDLIVEMVKSNSELQKNIIEMCKQIQPSNVNNNINNSNFNNKSFNLNFFLNETCKNAMNIMDFANSIQLNLTDLEKMGELGYVEGISKIIIDNLKLLDVTERPVHCSDFKRDVLYVKDDDKWEKENENNTKIKKLINSVTNKNISLIPAWKQKNPECTNINSNKSTKINKIIIETMETDKSKEEKIIKNIAKEVLINK